jgi:hypothetical protein
MLDHLLMKLDLFEDLILYCQVRCRNKMQHLYMTLLIDFLLAMELKDRLIRVRAHDNLQLRDLVQLTDFKLNL